MSGQYRIRPVVIDTARERLAVTSDEKLAHKLGLSSGTVSRARRGEELKFTTAIKLLDAAGVSLAGIEYVETKAA